MNRKVQDSGDMFPMIFTSNMDNEETDDTSTLDDVVGYKSSGLLVNTIWKILSSNKNIRDFNSEILAYLKKKAASERNSLSGVLLKAKKFGWKSVPNDVIFPSATMDVYSRGLKWDPQGLSLIHQVYMSNLFDLGRWIVQYFPEYSMEGSTSANEILFRGNFLSSEYMPYTGFNILHSAVLSQNWSECDWLLNFARKRSLADLGKLLNARSVGLLQQYDGRGHFGKSPFHYAVSINNIELVDLLLSYHTELRDTPSAIFNPDRLGNNLIHLCVDLNLCDMYKYIKMRARAIIRQELISAWNDNRTKINKSQRSEFYFPIHAQVTFRNEMEGREDFRGYLKVPRRIHFPDGSYKSKDKWKVLEFWLEGSAVVDGAVQQLYEDRLLHCLNEEGHSPLTLAAALGKAEMFEHLLEDMKFPLGKSNCHHMEWGLDLEGLLFPLPTSGPDPFNSPEDPLIEHYAPSASSLRLYSAIDWASRFHGREAKEKMLSTPAIKAVMASRWNEAARPVFQRNAITAITFSILITIGATFSNQSDTPYPNCIPTIVPTTSPTTSTEYVSHAGYAPTPGPSCSFDASSDPFNPILRANTYVFPVIYLVVFLILVSEGLALFHFGSDYWGLRGGIFGLAVFDKVMSSLLLLLLCIAAALRREMHLDDVGGLFFCSSMAIATVVTWLYSLQYLILFESMGPFLCKVVKILKKDVLYFCRFYIVILVGFGSAVGVLTSVKEEVFVTSRVAIFDVLFISWSLVKVALGLSTILTDGYDPLDPTGLNEHLFPLFDVLLFCYAVIVNLLLLNLLIGMFSATYDELVNFAHGKSNTLPNFSVKIFAL